MKTDDMTAYLDAVSSAHAVGVAVVALSKCGASARPQIFMVPPLRGSFPKDWLCTISFGSYSIKQHAYQRQIIDLILKNITHLTDVTGETKSTEGEWRRRHTPFAHCSPIRPQCS
jgi:hypothetical protein